MPCVNPQLIRELNIYRLDSCGRIVTGAAAALTNPPTQSFGWANSIDAATTTAKTNIQGATCDTITTCPVDNGVTVTMTTCGQNWALDALLGTGAIPVLPSGVVGYNRTDVSCTAQVAVEVIFEPDACAVGATTCLAILFPNVFAWTSTGDVTYDSKTKPDNVWTGVARKNGRLFQTSTPGELSHWTPFAADIAAGTSYYLARQVTCPAAKTSAPCDLRSVA